MLKLRNSKNLTKFEEFKSFPVAMFTFLVFWSFYNSNGMRFAQWDEFTQWGIAPKATFIFDALPHLVPVQMDNPGYTPGLTVLSYLALKVNNSWNESIVFWTYQLIFISVICAIISKFTYKNFWYAISSFVILILSGIIFYDLFQTVYADPILSIVFGYTIFLALNRDLVFNKFKFANYVIACLALYLIKDIGIVLAAISILIFFFNNLNLVSKSKDRASEIFLSVLRIGILSLVGFGSLYLMRLFWTIFSTKEEIANGINLASSESLSAINFTNSSNYDITNLQNYIFALRDRPLTFWNGVNLSFLDWIILFTIFLLVWSLHRKSFSLQRVLVTFAIIGGSLIYAAAIFAAYMTIFGSTGKDFPSYERYLSSYLAGVMFFLATQATTEILQYCKPDEDRSLIKYSKLTYLLILFLFFYSPQGRLVHFVTQPTSTSDTLRAQFETITQKIEFAQFSTDSKIYVITQHKIGFEYYYINYAAFPADVAAMPFSIGKDFGPSDFWTDNNMTPEKWERTLDDFDFVIIYNVSESFVNDYKSIFLDEDKIEEMSIYYVEHMNSGNKLVKFI